MGYYLSRVKFLLGHIFSGGYTPDLERMDYDDYWKIKKFDFAPRYEVFASLIEPGSTVLDIGCGNGANLRHLAKAKGVSGEGVDISEVAVKRALADGVKARVADASSPGFSLDGPYDYIIISEVLEHIPNPEDLLAKVRGKYRKGLILSVPNIGHYMHRLRLLFGHFPVQWAYHPAEHLRFWTISDFRLWLERQGLETLAFLPHSGFVFLHAIWPNLFADSSVFMVRERAAAPVK